MHLDYDHFIYPIDFQKMQIPATNQYLSWEITSVVLVKISERKKTSIFFDLKSHQNRLANRKKLIFSLEKYFKTSKEMIIGTNSFTIFQSGWNNGVKLWAFDECPGAFPDKVTPDIDSTDEAVVQYDVLDIKILF